MRILVTGSAGFVGRWLTEELRANGHVPVESSDLDVTDSGAVHALILQEMPDAIAHLAAISFAPEAAANIEESLEVTLGGTVNVLEAVRRLPNPASVLIAGSSEVYGAPAPDSLPLTEKSPLAPATPYALSKLAQESVGLSYATRYGINMVITRSFNHTGPGQRTRFAVPAIAQRVFAVASGHSAEIAVGNVNVRRDISDVRDVVVAYRLLLEYTQRDRLPKGALVVNVCSGRAVSIRWIIEELCRLADVKPRLRIDPDLVRPHEAPEIRGDPSLVSSITGWTRKITIEKTLADVWAAAAQPQPLTAA